jgi:hypothetical protein
MFGMMPTLYRTLEPPVNRLRLRKRADAELAANPPAASATMAAPGVTAHSIARRR